MHVYATLTTTREECGGSPRREKIYILVGCVHLSSVALHGERTSLSATSSALRTSVLSTQIIHIVSMADSANSFYQSTKVNVKK
jgi:hypothetical protein